MLWTPRCVTGGGMLLSLADGKVSWQQCAEVKSICHWLTLVLFGTGLETAGRIGLNIFYVLYSVLSSFLLLFSGNR